MDFNYGRYTPADNTGEMRNIFKSGFKNQRFAIPVNAKITLDSSTTANLVGVSYKNYSDVSLWMAILAFNGLTDAVSDPCVGLAISLPDKASLNAYISSQQNNSNPVMIL